ncbi:PAS domain S-box protein [Cupriavidus sp. IDO]|uniref:PAS domain S-box protein n=1 Tax=Cupriavidus sp. IDO TaxID=1539142 RepID=UPI000AEB80AC|nr:PAS domain S-box protein [Cupriavidus sp. IDO]
MIERLAEDAVLTLVDSLPDTAFLVDKAGKIKYVNAMCTGALGYSQSEIIGRSMIELVVPRDRDKTLKEAREVMAGHRRTGFENRYQHRDGSDIHLSWSARWLELHQLRLGIAHDVTALRQPACDHLIPAALLEALEPHEQKVLLLLLTAASENQIAGRLGLTASTTQAHITSIFRKLGVRGRMGLMSLCLRSLERK